MHRGRTLVDRRDPRLECDPTVKCGLSKSKGGVYGRGDTYIWRIPLFCEVCGQVEQYEAGEEVREEMVIHDLFDLKLGAISQGVCIIALRIQRQIRLSGESVRLIGHVMKIPGSSRLYG
jgi:hypothetical protein